MGVMNGNAGGERQENVRAGDFWLKDALCNVIYACYRWLLAISVQRVQTTTSPRTTNQLHEEFHGFQFPCRSNDQVRAPRVDPNFWPNWFEPRA